MLIKVLPLNRTPRFIRVIDVIRFGSYADIHSFSSIA